MTMLVTPSSATEADDGPAIAELHRLHAAQRAAFLADPYPDAAERKGHLMALAGMLLGHRDEIRAAMSADFGGAPGAVHRPGRGARRRRPRRLRGGAA